MTKVSSWVGMDVHKREIVAARLVGAGKEAEVWRFANEPRAIRRFERKLLRESSGRVECAYEAGPCGYPLQRQLQRVGIGCQVVAPSLIPAKPGERIKTDRRDAQKLAELLRAGLLTEVTAPGEEEESVRDLCRCRDSMRQDLMRARHRLGKLLLRRDLRYGKGRAWTHRHREWLLGLQFEHEAAGVAFRAYLGSIEQLEERLVELDEAISEIAEKDAYRESVGRLRCFRGIDTLSAMIILAELHDVSRFSSPRQLMAYLGLVPGERSSGEKTRRGGITKTGNSRVRRALIEAAWHARHKPAVGKQLLKRRKGQPSDAILLADRAMRRLHRRYWRFLQLGKPPQKAVTAVARELTGFVWATLRAAD